MAGAPGNDNNLDQPTRYEIRLKGRLDRRWTTWFDGLELSIEPEGTTLLAGDVADDAALHGLLVRVRDVGLPLISVIRADAPEGRRADGTSVNTTNHERTNS